MGINKSGKTTKTTNAELVAIIVKQNELMAQMVGKVLDQTTEIAKAQREWLGLFKPLPTGPQKSTEEREAAATGAYVKGAEDSWTSIDAHRMLAELGFQSTDDDEREM